MKKKKNRFLLNLYAFAEFLCISVVIYLLYQVHHLDTNPNQIRVLCAEKRVVSSILHARIRLVEPPNNKLTKIHKLVLAHNQKNHSHVLYEIAAHHIDILQNSPCQMYFTDFYEFFDKFLFL